MLSRLYWNCSTGRRVFSAIARVRLGSPIGLDFRRYDENGRRRRARFPAWLPGNSRGLASASAGLAIEPPDRTTTRKEGKKASPPHRLASPGQVSGRHLSPYVRRT